VGGNDGKQTYKETGTMNIIHEPKNKNQLVNEVKLEIGPCGDPIIQGKIMLLGERKIPYLIFKCPWCGKRHYHGFSEDITSPFHFISHCPKYNGCYYVKFERGKK
jgi:hypothetical protein